VEGYGTELLARMAEAGAAEWSLVLASPFIGSFLGLLIQRLPDAAPIARGRSRCDACGAPLRARDLVPLFSWLVADGRCRYCRQPLGWFYPGVELAAMAVAVAAVLIDGGQRAWLDCLLGWWLLALGWIDLRSWLLPDALTLPLIIAGLAAAFLFNPDQLTERALGAALGYASLMTIAALYRALRGREGLGGGDAKLLAASGAWRCRPGIFQNPQIEPAIGNGGDRIGSQHFHRRLDHHFRPWTDRAEWRLSRRHGAADRPRRF